MNTRQKLIRADILAGETTRIGEPVAVTNEASNESKEKAGKGLIGTNPICMWKFR